jgi:Zn-dependent peptidase ImmA (M78 family)
MITQSWNDRCCTVAAASSADQLRRLLLSQAHALADMLDCAQADHREWQRLGVRVQRKGMFSAGACLDMGTYRIVYVRADDEYRRQRFTVAHEVAHLLLTEMHSAGRVTLSHSAEERLCDAFAAALLVPPERLDSALSGLNWEDPDDLLLLCRKFRVGIQPMAISLAQRWSQPDRMLLVAQRMGHPLRPREVAARVLTHAGSKPVFIPRDQRLRSLSLTGLASWADAATGETRATGKDSVTFKTWSKAHPRSMTGTCQAIARWNAHRLSNGLILALLEFANIRTSWAMGRSGAN